jgi:DNA-binding protein HU-beta
MAGIKDVAAVVAEATGVSKAAAEESVKAVFAAITDLTDAGDSVAIRGFGSFRVKEYAARECPNPQKPGEKVQVPAKEKLTFKASK